jgi:hypothetical protein
VKIACAADFEAPRQRTGDLAKVKREAYVPLSANMIDSCGKRSCKNLVKTTERFERLLKNAETLAEVFDARRAEIARAD